MQPLLRNPRQLIFNGSAALLAGAFTYYALRLLPYYPVEWHWPAVVAAVILWVVKPNLGVAFSLTLFLFQIAYNSLSLAFVFFLLLILIAIVEIWAIGPYGFLVLAAVTVIAIQPELRILLLAAPLLAGFLGVKRGAVLGTLSCFWAQGLALLAGQATLGLLAIKAQAAPLLIIKSKPMAALFDFSWVDAQLKGGNIDTT